VKEVKIMTIQEAINVRTSRRKYLEGALEQMQSDKLQKLITEYNQIGGFRIELVLNNGEAFNGFTRSYGMLSGVNHYFGFIAHEDDPHADEKIGYYGELLVLHATTLGLGTCWVGGTFSKSKTPFNLTANERLACLITVGNIEETHSFKEKLIYHITHRKTKSLEKMFTTNGPVPDWFLKGMEAVQKAPSAMNKQPVMFSYQDGCIKAAVKSTTKYLVAFDLGIAKLHFELGSGGGKWQWGNGAEFVRD
jgi:nitroreductase